MIPSGHTAVMASRVEPRDSLDDFPTPPWATRALCVHVLRGEIGNALEPACGRGHMLRALREHIPRVDGFDLHDYGIVRDQHDFLDRHLTCHGYDLIATNPPFRLAAQFARRALAMAPKVALLVRTQWTESLERYQLFQRPSPSADRSICRARAYGPWPGRSQRIDGDRLLLGGLDHGRSRYPVAAYSALSQGAGAR